MDYKDYYAVLGVPRTASQAEIKRAFRKLAREHHPDVRPGDGAAERRFKEISEANEVLSDPEKRKRYDTLGSNWEAYQRAGAGGADPFGPGGPFAGFRTAGGPGNVRFEFAGDPGDFSEFFRTFFGGGGGFGGFGGFPGEEEAFVPASDAEAEVDLTLAEVLRGTTREVAVGGSRRRVEVKIPPGVREGSRVRVAGEGGKGAGGRRGDLYLRVRIAADPTFERKGDDLQTTVRVPLTSAVLGGEAQVPSLEGPVGIKVPAGTPAGQVFRLRGHGLPKLGGHGERGDLLATLAVDLPRTLTPRQRELFEELRRSGT
jgi:curved DNA-binding protein